MKRIYKTFSLILGVVVAATALTPCVYAKNFAQKIDTSNLGVTTQYAYASNDPSWLRKLVVKEDMLSVEGIATEVKLHPVTDYPYTNDAPNFKAQVDENVKLYTLDEDSQRAAYIYVLQQIGALSIISDPNATDKSKADWLRKQGIVITEEDENDPEKILMISALYALMKNDLYYVYTGEHLTIPDGTPLEKAVVIYLTALSGQDSTLASFLLKFFNGTSIGTLEDYIYYTSLMALYTAGYVSPVEIAVISREEVYRRVAIMTIRKAGLAIDSDSASTEEIQQKYLTAMLGTHYSVTLDPESLKKAIKKDNIPFYILQRMAYEDSNITISQTAYNYEECFNIVLEKTDRFKLENKFYSDIREYNVFLSSKRSSIAINPTPISKTGTSVYINSKEVSPNEYTTVNLNGTNKQTVSIVSRQKTNNKTTSTTYKLNIYQGTDDANGSNITGIIESIGNNISPTGSGTVTSSGSHSADSAQVPSLTPVLESINAAAANLISGVLSRNEQGQLVDQNGNIVSNNSYETLPDGYKYVLNEDGVITIMPINDTESTDAQTTASADEDTTDTKIRKIAIVVSGASLVVLIAIAAVIILTKRKHMTESEKTKLRRDKEKAKKAKREAKADRKKK